MDEELRNSLWNAMILSVWKNYSSPSSHHLHVENTEFNVFAKVYWMQFLKLPVDKMAKEWDRFYDLLRLNYFESEWYEVYEFIEFVIEEAPIVDVGGFTSTCNDILEVENSAYRIVNGNTVEIASRQEIREVEAAIEAGEPYAGVRDHLEAALTLLSDRRNPDYRNSIKESVSAVESLAQNITGKKSATLGQLLKEMESSMELPTAIREAFSKLYGYTSSEDGIRHALSGKSSVSSAHARFMLICCSAFINFVIDSTKERKDYLSNP